MDKQKAAEKIVKESLRLSGEVMAALDHHPLEFVLEDKNVILAHIARLKILKEEFMAIVDKAKIDGRINNDKLLDDDVVKLRKMLSEVRSITHTILGL